MVELDCRGLTCPNPVLKTKKLIDGGVERAAVLVDNQAASINVTNFLKSRGFQVLVEERGSEYLVQGDLIGSPETDPATDDAAGACEVMDFGSDPRKNLALICNRSIGEGDEELGLKLMTAYLSTLKEMGDELWRIVLLNSGVKLAIQGAPTVEALKDLEQAGVSILVCGTCLTHYDLMDKKVVGETTNMLDVVTSLQLADKVISMT